MLGLLKTFFKLPDENQRRLTFWRWYRVIAPFPSYFFAFFRKPEIYIYHRLYRLSAGFLIILIGLGWLSFFLGIKFSFGVASIDLTGTQYVSDFTRSLTCLYLIFGLIPILLYGLALGRFNIDRGYDFFWHIEDMSYKNNQAAKSREKYIRYINLTWPGLIFFLAAPPLLPFSITFLFSPALRETPFALALVSLLAFVVGSPLPWKLCEHVFVYRSIFTHLRTIKRF